MKSTKKAGIKFDVEEEPSSRTPLKSILIPAEFFDETEKESRKSVSSIKSAENDDDNAEHRANQVKQRSTRGISIFGIRGVKRRTHGSDKQNLQKTITLQPTYQLGPLWPYEHTYVQKIMNQSVDLNFSNYKYDIKSIDKMCQRTTIAIQKRIIGLKFNRYRNICYVVAGEKFYQDLMIQCGFLWDKEFDVYDTYLMERPDFFVLAIVFGVYYD